MRFAVDVAPLGDYADPRVMARIAAAAEASGWDGLSTWDVLATTMGGAADPFVALAAAAAATERIRLIVSVVALPRRRPQLVAQSAATLDLMSGGRLVLGIGAGGDPADFEAFGEPWEASVRIPAMDEAAARVDAWLRGESVLGAGATSDGVVVGPRPAQRPRPQVWFGGSGRRAALRRASAWDGWIAVSVSEDGRSLAMSPDALAPLVERVRDEAAVRGRDPASFEIAVFGQDGLGGGRARDYEAAGATWWLESFSPMRCSLDDLITTVAYGPPTG